MEKYYTLNEVAMMTGLNTRTLRNYLLIHSYFVQSGIELTALQVLLSYYLFRLLPFARHQASTSSIASRILSSV